MTAPRLYDEGLQPERTELAWRRTALSFGVAAVVGFRLLSEALGDPSWALPVLCAISASGVLWIAARRRYRATNIALLSNSVRDLPAGGLLFATMLMIVVLSVGGLAATLALALSRS